MKKIHLIYYSPALSTRKIMRAIAKGCGTDVIEYDITMGKELNLTFGADDFVLFGVPSFSGRVPIMATEALKSIRGNDTLSAIVCVYGNRDYDDTLLELKDISEQQGFKTIAAGAFIARHSIFPNVAKDHPNKEDMALMEKFGKRCIKEISNNERENKTLHVKGNYPYREIANIPLKPKGDKKCDSCGTCVKQCPTHAIPANAPKSTNKQLCISCGRCIAVCPQQSRKFRGLLYTIVRRKFESKYASLKEVEFFFAK